MTKALEIKATGLLSDERRHFNFHLSGFVDSKKLMESHRYLTAAGGVPLEVVLQVAVDTDG